MFSAPRPCMRRFVQCEDGIPVMLHDEESIVHTIPSIDLTFSADESPSTGTLYVTSKRFIWLSAEASYDFDVPFIALHAISNDPESYKKPCLYCQFDQDGDEEIDEDEPTEVFFIPADEKDVQKLFDIFSEAALNNPDDNEDDEEDGDGGDGGGMFSNGFIYNVDEVEAGAQQAKLNQWESVFQMAGGGNSIHTGGEGGTVDTTTSTTQDTSPSMDESDKDVL
mmetsp:Transcript_17577/g.29456  ORF Transcript_17577/g.29456 Transcript_17577/m.29456 type:complete len:223 (+) Transcript_17577:72-740(+)|eukprot:CAMPEP_0114423822 /NCGR_PEP_ID=MMETSP0103-20121206/6360_1 /TAXON_ID=37642 ORGANISM="Paraphysomonas imperforata, Strain PA2" /NCGR_SAMPLE_ID=MMETSP0103 /ASSEMBLY_ACC=CAM_ASM_000201 /LENGTH=222 /DNA_ID=CAMNT_0001592523 /DNA_START=48 /DNA_END=716 /DNA_ORIENTATION=-